MESPTPPIPTLLQRLQRGLSTIEFVHLPHDRWPLRASLPYRNGHHVQISVLDSSFNPPTLAHLALANSPLSRPSVERTNVNNPSSNEEPLHDYDAKLLLLSIRNAEKALRADDATYHQRLEMMLLLAKDVLGYDQNGVPTVDANVGVAVINEPRFVDKSRLLLTFLRRRLADFSSMAHLNGALAPETLPSRDISVLLPRLTFLQGLDTLGRLFLPQYYHSEEAMINELHHFFSDDEDASRVVCARRIQSPINFQEVSGGSEQREAEELAQIERELLIKEYIETGQITLIDIGKDERTFSSTKLRERVRRGDNNWRKLTTERIVQYILENNLYGA